MSHRTSTWVFAAALVAAPASAQLISDVQAFPVSKSYPHLGEGDNASDPLALLVTGKGCAQPLAMTRDGKLLTIELASDDIPPILPVPCSPFAFEYFIDRLPAATYELRVQADGQVVFQRSFVVAPPVALLTLLGNEYILKLEYKVPGSPPKAAFGVPLGVAAAYFWFFSPDNPEVQVKVIDGRALNGHRWLFLSSATTLEFDLVVEPLRCPPTIPLCSEVKRYHQAAGRARSIFDVTFD